MATNGPDSIFGTFGNDVLEGFLGNDLLFASVGQDVLDGGGDYDVALYEDPSFISGVFINNTNVQIGSVASFTVDKRGFGTDSLVSIEAFNASNYDDIVYVGGLGGSHSFDRAGDDVVFASQDPNAIGGHVFVAGSGNDTYYGSVNRDALDLQNDSFDALGAVTQAAVVDLVAGTATDGWGFQDTLFSIEDVWGTPFNDTLLGDDNDNEIEGQDGDDLIEGRGGNDTLFGGLGKDTIRGGDGDDYIEGDGGFDVAPGAVGDDDVLEGGAGDDHILGGDGNDTLDGGDGDDVLDASGGSADSNSFGDWVVPGLGRNTIIGHADLFLNREDGIDLSYANLSGIGGITLTVGANGTGTAVSGIAGQVDDTFTYAHRFRGTQDADVLIGSDNPNWEGWEGWAGDDTIDGAGGFDELLYHQETGDQGTTVNFQTGIAKDTWGNTDSFSNIEAVRGSRHGDTFTGNGALEYVRYRGLDGADIITGSSGFDELDHSRDENYGGTAGITARLDLGTVVDGFGRTDTVSGIDKVKGTDFDDVMVGSDADEEFEGLGGDDQIDGAGGNDRLFGGDGDDTLAGGDGDDELTGGRGNDTLDGGASFQAFSGGDSVRYYREGGSLGVTVNLGTGTATDTYGDTDTLISIEEAFGTDNDDTLIGSNGSDRLDGRGGDDYLEGGDGNDDLSGGSGDDTIIGGAGGDFIEPGSGNDTITAGADGDLGERDELSYIYASQDHNGTVQGIAVTFTSEGTGTVIDFAGDTDTFSGVEAVRGTNLDDVFIGSDGDQTFLGFGGNDSFDGGAGDGDRLLYVRGDNVPGQIQGIVVDWEAGTVTDRFGDTDTFVNIERIDGSDFDDVMIGNGDTNTFRGNNGDDLLDSVGGRDNRLDGDRGNDTIHARGDNDGVQGGDGNDTITFYGNGGWVNPGLGSDVITGGPQGRFYLGYWGVGTDLVIDAEAGTTTFANGSDVDSFTNFVEFEGGEGNDILRGTEDGSEEFFRSLGDDHMDGRGAVGEGVSGPRDLLIYGHSSDTERFTAEEVAVTVNFANGTVVGQLAGNDTFENMEGVRGSFGNDHFIGSDQAYEEFQGMDGADIIEGGGGLDRIRYNFEDNRGGSLGITIDLAGPVNSEGFLEVKDTFGNVDLLKGIEQVAGSDFDDDIAGDDGDNSLIGFDGADRLIGRGGDDLLWGDFDTDTMTGGAGADDFAGFVDTLDGDVITDFSIEDMISIYDRDFNDIAADATIVGNELRLDIDGDGLADATMILQNGYTGAVNVRGGPLGGPEPSVFSVENAGRFTSVVDEGASVATVVINRSGDVFSAASVDFRITGTGLNPVNGDDISAPFDTPVTLEFAPGQDQLIYQIGLVDDLAVENFEDLAFTLSNAASDGAGGAEIAGAETYVRILNNDVPATVNITGEKARENSGFLTFTVDRTGDTTEPLTVAYAVASAGGLQGAEDDDLVGGLPQSGTVIIPAGADSASFSLEIAPDLVPELHDDVIATISAGSDWPAGLVVGAAQAIGSIRNDDGVPPVLPLGATGSNFGDPHLVTLDGLAYDFQAVGEFCLIETVSGDPLDIQVRFQPVSGSQVASQTTAVATLLGSTRVVVDIAGSSLVAVDGVALDVSDAIGGLPVGDGNLFYDGEAITLVYATGEQLRIDVFDGFLSTSVSIAQDRDVRGLLGNADGDASNDLALRDGTVLPQPVSFADLYGVYADAWRVSDTSSLFDYAPGQGTADFTDLGFPAADVTLDDFPVEVVAAAQAAVAAAGVTDPILAKSAALDLLLSGDTSFVEAAAAVEESPALPTSQTAPTDAPDILAGIGISALEVDVTEGDAGTQEVVFTIYRTGDLGASLSLTYEIGGDVDLEDYVGPSSGILDFDVGEASKLIAVEISGDTDFESNEVLSLSFELTDGDDPMSPTILSSTARVSIINDDIDPPEPEVNEIFGTGQSDYLTGTDGADRLVSLGGRYDKMLGGAGADEFVFGAETRNGARERDVIDDFNTAEDVIVLTDGAEISQIRETSSAVILVFEGDRDAVYLRGSGLNADDITVFVDDFDL